MEWYQRGAGNEGTKRLSWMELTIDVPPCLVIRHDNRNKTNPTSVQLSSVKWLFLGSGTGDRLGQGAAAHCLQVAAVAADDEGDDDMMAPMTRFQWLYHELSCPVSLRTLAINTLSGPWSSLACRLPRSELETDEMSLVDATQSGHVWPIP